MTLAKITRAIIKDLAETRLDNGARSKALRMVQVGRDTAGNAVLDGTGAVVLRGGETVLGRADFTRFGLAVLYAPAQTSATRRALIDVEQTIDLTVTDQRIVLVYDELSTKGHWDGDGIGKVLAVGMNVAHGIGSKIRHHGEAAVFEVELDQLNRVLAPSVPTFTWAYERSLTFGWQEERNLGVGEMRIVLLDQQNETEHLEMGRLLLSRVSDDETETRTVNWPTSRVRH